MNKVRFDPGLTEHYTGGLRRTINDDGSFNVHRRGAPWKDAGWFLYFMNLRWPAFLVQVPMIYMAVIAAFAGIYLAVGIEHLRGAPARTTVEAVSSAFFFSVQTFTTVGYGHIAPDGFGASTVAAVEAMSGILSLAVATGLIFARFSRPEANIEFSRQMVVAPFQEGRALMFRLANRRPNVLMELEARVLLMTVTREDGVPKRTYKQLELERPGIYFLPISWTVVHPMDANSPLTTLSEEDLERGEVEFLVLVKAFDDTFSQTVHARHSYTWREIEWGVKFTPAFHANEQGDLVLDLDRLSETTSAPLERRG
jgi:inward rectifier potassium channel